MRETTNSGPTNEGRLAAMREIQQCDRVCEEAAGVRRATLKRLTAEGHAIVPLRIAIRASKRDHEDVQIELRQTVHNMALRGIIPEDILASFLDGADLHVTERAREEDKLWGASELGYKAGRDGTPINDCPYIEGSESAQAWSRSWHDGQAALVMTMGERERPADASRERPVRDEDEAPPPESNVVEMDAAKAGKPGRGTKGTRGKKPGKAGKPGRRKLEAPADGHTRGPRGNGGQRQPALLTDDRPRLSPGTASPKSDIPKKRGRPSRADVAARDARPN